jgi:hypothetical protein
MPSDKQNPEQANLPADLSHAGAIIDKAVEYMVSQNIAPQSIASALLGGAIGILVRGMDDQGVIRILERAIAGVRNGDLRRLNT